MSSSYSHGERSVWVSNGTGDVIARLCLEFLASRSDEDGVGELREALEFIVEVDAVGMMGFRLDSDPFSRKSNLALLEQAIAGAAAMSADILEARAEPSELLEFLRRIDEGYQAHWLANLVLLHAMLLEAQGVPPAPLELHISDSRAALVRADIANREAARQRALSRGTSAQ